MRWWPRRSDEDFRTEIEAHIALETERLVADGLSPDAARAAALKTFGNVTLSQERFYESHRNVWLADLRKDIAYALRTLGRNRGFALVAILTLALGIGANAAIFSVVRGVVLKPLPYVDPGGLVLIRQSASLAGQPDASVSVRELYDYREQTRSFEALVEYHPMTFDLLKRGEPDRVSVGVVSYNFFDVLGIRPMLGRSFEAADDGRGADAVLILSYSYWQTKFGSDTNIVGQVFQMNDRPHTVVGVLPNVPHYPQENDVYMPVSSCPFRAAAEQQAMRNRRFFAMLTVFGRLKPGLSRASATRDVEAVCGRFTHANGTVYRPEYGFAGTTRPVRDELVREARPMLLILLGTTALVLLLACANVANLALARLLRRDRELALRQALGARRGRIVRQLLTESTLLSLIGGAVGLALAAPMISLLAAFAGRFTSRTGEIAIDSWVLAFTLIVSVLTGVAFGTVPALMSRMDIGAMMRSARGSEHPGRHRFQNGLVVAQVAVSVVLLIGAGLLLASFYRLQRVDTGYRAERVLTAEIFGNFSKYPDKDSFLRFIESVTDRLRSASGVVSVAVTNAVPLRLRQPGNARFQIAGRELGDLNRGPSVGVVTPNYFLTLGIPLLDGRAFGDHDGGSAMPVAIVNQTMRMRYWRGSEALGSRVSFDNGLTWRTVVGIVGDVKQFGLDRDADSQVYLPLAQSAVIPGLILVRTTNDPVSAAEGIRRNVHEVDPDMPVENVTTLDQLRQDRLATPQLTATLLSIFAALALLITMTGITGVMTMYVAQRLREFGVRVALGASREQVLRPVLGQAFRLIAIGLIGGMTASIAITQVLSSYLFATTPTDPVTFAGVAVAFLLAGGLACVGPAWRATRVDPLVVLRAD